MAGKKYLNKRDTFLVFGSPLIEEEKAGLSGCHGIFWGEYF